VNPMIDRASDAAEEAMRDISVCEDADGMAYGLLDAMAEARCEKELSGAGDVLRDASVDVARATLVAALNPDDKALQILILQAMKTYRIDGFYSAWEHNCARSAIAAIQRIAQDENDPAQEQSND